MAYTQATLEMCERHVVQGERHIADQKARIATMGARGLPILQAEGLLETLLDMQSLHTHHRDMVKSDLEKSRKRLAVGPPFWNA